MSNVHPFEAAGLGKAPFKFIGHYESKFQACPGAPVKAGSCCDYCPASIMQVFMVRSADGKEFKVGSDCIMKVDDRELVAAVKVVEAVAAKAKRLAAASKRREAAKVAKSAKTLERATKATEDLETYTAEVAQLDTLAAEHPNSWAGDTSRDMAARVRQGFGLSEKQLALVAKMWADRAARQTMGHVGAVGKRTDLALTMMHEHTYMLGDSPRYVVTFKDASGNALVWFTATRVVHQPESGPIAVTVRATIKEHSERKGVPQTIIERATIKYPAGMTQTWDEELAAREAAFHARMTTQEDLCSPS